MSKQENKLDILFVGIGREGATGQLMAVFGSQSGALSCSAEAFSTPSVFAWVTESSAPEIVKGRRALAEFEAASSDLPEVGTLEELAPDYFAAHRPAQPAI